jgi:hypothetical protein
MEYADSIFAREFPMEELFAFEPAEFQLEPDSLRWESPCWLKASIVISPQSPAARGKFITNLSMLHRLDAFAKASWESQLWAAFAPRFSQIEGPYRDDWWHTLFQGYENLKQRLNETESLFPVPLRFAKRADYANVDLPTILERSPETLSLYISTEKRTYREYSFLRIHSAPPFLGSQPICQWFEKRLPDSLHVEDVLPWFHATIRRLPKKHQPPEIDGWVNRLLHFEPRLAPVISSTEQSRDRKPKVIIVFGAVNKVGYRHMFHLERSDISCVMRQEKIIMLKGKTRHSFSDGKTMEVERTFHLLTSDEEAAERIEDQIIHAKKTHFGLNVDVVGMLSRSDSFIHAINVPVETIRSLCVEPLLDLVLSSNPREKHKLYEVVDPRGNVCEAYAQVSQEPSRP